MTETTVARREMSSHPMVLISYKLRNLVEFFGENGAYFILPLVLFTMLDVFGRKLTGTSFDVQLWLVENVSRMFQSTMLQELEWHVHTALFSLVLGYGFTRNRHVRVDLVRMHLQTKAQAFIEFVGTSFFMIPYTLVVLYFCYVFTYDSFITNEISPSLVGMTHRWIIKTVLGVGLIIALLSGIAVWLQSAMVLFGPKELRFELMTLEWPEDMGQGVEGYERMVLADQETDMKKIAEGGKG
jgi:TRAP-type mannitol/chloroaromatic compound transport system permease small subunit